MDVPLRRRLERSLVLIVLLAMAPACSESRKLAADTAVLKTEHDGLMVELNAIREEQSRTNESVRLINQRLGAAGGGQNHDAALQEKSRKLSEELAERSNQRDQLQAGVKLLRQQLADYRAQNP